jgi:predicted transcriptional regulator
MAEEAYETALRQALGELAEIEKQAEEIERKRARLRQGVAVLQTLTGDQPDQEQSVTSSILMVLNASPGPLPTVQIIQRLQSMGYTPQPTSVATLLSRLAKDGKIMKADDGYGMTSGSTELFYDAMKKLEATREELARGITKSDHDAAKIIFEDMCTANLPHTLKAETIHHLAMASVLYAQAVLRLDMGAQSGVSVESDRTLTEAILLIVKGSPGAVTASEVMEKLFMLGLQAQTASVASILSRLAENRKIMCLRDPGGSSLLGYEWKTPRTKSEMLAANKAAAELRRRGKQ